MDAGEPVSRGLLGIAAAQGDGMARDEKWARGLIQDFLDSGFLSEVSKGIVEVLTADMRNAGFSQAEIEMHRKVLLQAMDGIAPLPGDAGVITTLLNRPASPPAIEEPLEAFAAAGNVNAMLALAFEYFDRHHKGPGELAEETRLKDWKAMRASLEARSGPLPVDVLAVLTPEEKRDYDQLASVTKPRDALALDRITSSIEASLRKEHAKSVEANRKRIAEWIGRGAEHGNRIAIALDAIIQAQGYAGPANRDAATARGRQLAARGLFDLTETVLEYTASLAAAQPAPSETLVELTRAERTTVRDILRRFFGGIRARNDLVSPILALIALTGGGDPIQGESGAYDWLLTASRKEGNALAGVVLALRLMSTAGPAGAVQSANHFQLAAEQGEPLAQLALGIMYARGLGVARDEYFARRWVGMALGQGKLGEDIRKLVPIVSRVATAAPHLIGFSVPERRVFDALAAEKGQTEALIAFAVLVPDRNADAKDWLRKAADAGNESAKALLADSELSAALAAHHP
jgi:hypothetical protein